ncbi:MAG: hypothetical protein ACK45C_13470, partial [Bacteroidota bacterium]
LLYHEATFLHERADRAAETFHSTALQAAQIAQTANVKRLMIGHFSARYNDAQPLLDEAQSVFVNTVEAVEGQTYAVGVSSKSVFWDFSLNPFLSRAKLARACAGDTTKWVLFSFPIIMAKRKSSKDTRPDFLRDQGDRIEKISAKDVWSAITLK